MTIKKMAALACAVSLALSLFSSCKSSASAGKSKEGTSNKLQVYTSFYAMQDFTQKIAGDQADIYLLVPTGVEPHDWEPSTTDMLELENADLLIYNGAGMESWVEKVAGALDNQHLTLVEAAKGVPELEQESHGEESGGEEAENEGGHDHSHGDPHVWLNPQNVKVQMKNIANALSQADPENEKYYQANYEAECKKLDALDSRFQEAASHFVRHDMIVAHEAYGYLCQAYGLTQHGIEGLAADSDPSPARMADLVKLAQEKGLTTVFFEVLVSPKTANALANEAGLKTAVLDPFEGNPNGQDYYAVMEQNLSALKEALGA